MIRIYTDYNITPIQQPNILWETDKTQPRYIQTLAGTEYMRCNGYELMPMAYNGTLNRTTTWYDAATDSLVPLDWGRGEGNYSDPPTESACKAVAKLWFDARHYVTSPVIPSQLPLIFDLEGTYWNDLNQNEKCLQSAIAVRWVKNVFRDRAAVGHYFLVPAGEGGSLTEGEKEYLNVADFVAPSFYSIPSWQEDARWFDNVDHVTRLLDRYCSWMPRIAVLHPLYQVHWIDQFPALAKMNNTPVPMTYWTKQLKFVVERDYDVYVWMGSVALTDTIKKLLLYAATLAK